MPLGTPATATPSLGALTCLGVLWAISGCFNVNYGHCRITCSASEACPANLECRMAPNATQGVCAEKGSLACLSESPDAGPDAMDGSDGSDTADAMDGSDGADAETGGPFPPEVLCHNGNCFPLPPEVRANIVLLLWPSNLPAVGSPVSVWQDQSGQGNHATALTTDLPPHVIPDGVQLDSSQRGTGLGVYNSPSLDFGAGDFAVIVVAGLSSSTIPVTLFRKWDGVRVNSRRISIDWVLSSPPVSGRPQGAVNDTLVVPDMDTAQPSVRAYTLRRAIDRIELHLNEAILVTTELPTAGASTSNAEDVYLGVAGAFGDPADSLEAVIAIRGSIRSTDLNQLQIFLRTVFATP